MTISVSDTLTADNSGKYILSIRLRSGGLSFSGYSPSINESLFYKEVEFDRTKPYISSLKEFFFENEFLTYTYKWVHIVSVSSRYTLVPEEFFQEKDKERLYSLVFSPSRDRCLNVKLKDEQTELLFGIDEEVYEFCSRTVINPHFTHHMAPLLALWKKQSKSRLPRQLFVMLRQKEMEVACYEHGSLLLVNSFEFNQPDDILYYILYVWKQTGLDQQKDQLQIAGETVLRNTIVGTLRTYLQYIEPQEIPSEAYLLGAEITQVPMDLIALSVCEL